MDRHFGAARCLETQKKKKPQNLGQFLMKFSTKSHGDSNGPMIEDDQRSSYAGFPPFINMATSGPLNRQTSSNNRARPSPMPLSSSKSPAKLCLPILRVSVDVSIDGTISHTKVTQSFHNPSEINIPEARHTFPLYYSAVVTSFECKIGDSRRLRGVVKPTAQARREFEEAKKKKREAAALLEELTPEIFETSLGNIPANTTVEIQLTYVHELKVVTSKEEKSEGLAVIIPASAAPRYAAAVMPVPTPEVPSDQLEITIRVFDDGSINPVGSHVESNHPSTTYHGLQPSSNLLIANIAELHNFNSATSSVQKMEHVWKYSCESQPILKGDYVFVIQMLGETRLQSHAVIAPANDMGHAALMVHLRPNDIFGSAIRPELFKGEVLFVLDRSKSMSWTQEGTDRRKIETMRNAMSLALSGLPSTCRFNIISFGSEVRGMWNRSRRADEPDNLSYAREYVANVKADMRGTKILLALKGAINNRGPECPSTQVILITDGEIDREPHSHILKYVWKTRKRHGEKIRFFTLGIGDSVSHSVLESVAELGGGYCDIVDVVKKPRWEGCLNRMLRSVMEPDAWTCDIDLGPGYKRQSLATEKFGMKDGDGTNFILYAQGPHPILSLQPFRYRSFFFLLDLRNADMPKLVTIKTTADTAKKKAYTMEIKPSQLRENTIHPLAIKTILRSLEDEVKRTGASVEQARFNAECLGTKYAISSNWTSFIAIVNECEERTCQIDTYKSRFRKADFEKLLASDGEESSEFFWRASGPNSMDITNIVANGLFPPSVVVSGRISKAKPAKGKAPKEGPAKGKVKRMTTNKGKPAKGKETQITIDKDKPVKGKGKGKRITSDKDKPAKGKGRRKPDSRKSKHIDRSVSPLHKQTRKCNTRKNSISNADIREDAPGQLCSKGENDDNRSKEYESVSFAYCSSPPCEKVAVLLPESISRKKGKVLYQTTPQPYNENIESDDDTEADRSHSLSASDNLAALSNNLITQGNKSYIQRPKCNSLVDKGSGSKIAGRDNFLDGSMGKSPASNAPSSNAKAPEAQDSIFGLSYNVGHIAYVPREHEDVLFYRPSGDGPITWQDAAGCENGGMFVLPSVVRERLRQHFCDMTVEHLQETLRGSSGAKVAEEEEEAVLFDTLMMIEYLKTHLQAQEDYWSLLTDKAERALLAALGYAEDQYEALEPLYKTLLSAIFHVHFPESLKHASIYQEDANKNLAAPAFETCLVCNTPIETDGKKKPITDKGYMCLADECYDSKTQRRKTYCNWKMFWDHQVQSGHLLCPETSE